MIIMRTTMTIMIIMRMVMKMVKIMIRRRRRTMMMLMIRRRLTMTMKAPITRSQNVMGGHQLHVHACGGILISGARTSL